MKSLKVKFHGCRNDCQMMTQCINVSSVCSRTSMSVSKENVKSKRGERVRYFWLAIDLFYSGFMSTKDTQCQHAASKEKLKHSA